MEEIILKEREFKTNLVDLVNQSGLPAFVLKPIIKELYDQLVILEQEQYEQIKREQEEKQNKLEKGEKR